MFSAQSCRAWLGDPFLSGTVKERCNARNCDRAVVGGDWELPRKVSPDGMSQGMGLAAKVWQSTWAGLYGGLTGSPAPAQDGVLTQLETFPPGGGTNAHRLE